MGEAVCTGAGAARQRGEPWGLARICTQRCTAGCSCGGSRVGLCVLLSPSLKWKPYLVGFSYYVCVEQGLLRGPSA